MDHIICDATGEPCFMLKACDNERGCVSLRERQRTEMQTREQMLMSLEQQRAMQVALRKTVKVISTGKRG